MIATNLALVGDPGQPTGARQDREQRHLGQRHCRRAVIEQDDVIGRERKLIAASRRRSVDDANGAQAGMRARVLDAIARLVGELAEIDLVRVARTGQHTDIGTGAKHVSLARLHDHCAHFRMLEAQPLYGVGQFDIDAEIVRIEF